MQKIRSSIDGVVVEVPEDATEDQIKAAFQEKRALQRASQQNPNPEPLTMQERAQRRAKEQSQEPTMEERARERIANQPETTAGGMLGGALRGAGPIAAGALAGAPLGPLGVAGGAAAAGIAQAVSPAITNAINKSQGTNYQNLAEWFTSMGAENPDTAAEQTVQNMSQALAGTAAGIGGGQLMAAGAPVLGGAQTSAQAIGQTISANPAQQAIGAAGGASVEQEIANRTGNMNPALRSALMIIGGISGDLIASGLPGVGNNPIATPGQKDVDEFVALMRNADITPEMARRAIREGTEPAVVRLMDELNVPREVAEQALQEGSGKIRRLLSRTGLVDSDVRVLAEAGVDRDVADAALRRAREVEIPVFRSDLTQPDRAGQADIEQQRVNEALGMRGPRTAQGRARNALVRDTFAEFGVEPGANRLISQDMADNFVERHNNILTPAVEAQRAARNTFPSDEFVPVPNTVDYIDGRVDYLERIGGTTGDVNVPQTPGADAVTDASQRNAYQSTIEELSRLRGQLQNKSMEDLNTIRQRDLSRRYSTRGGLNEPASSLEQDVLNDVYRNIVQDMDNAIQRHGGEEMAAQWRNANSTISDLKRQMHSDALKNLVKRAGEDGVVLEAHPEVIQSVIESGDPSVVREVMGAMDYRGQTLVETALMQDVFNNATTDIRDISGGVVANQIHERFEQIGVPMTPEKRQRIEGLANLLDLTRRPERMLAERAADPTAPMSKVPSGRYTTARILSQHPLMAATGVAGGLLSARNLARAYESPATRDLLLELAADGTTPRRQEQIVQLITRALTSRDTVGQTQDVVEGTMRAPEATRGALQERRLRINPE